MPPPEETTGRAAGGTNQRSAPIAIQTREKMNNSFSPYLAKGGSMTIGFTIALPGKYVKGGAREAYNAAGMGRD